MSLIALVAGIILLATNGWFSGQHRVGLILTIVGALLVLLQFVVFAGTARKIKREIDRFPSNEKRRLSRR